MSCAFSSAAPSGGSCCPCRQLPTWHTAGSGPTPNQPTPLAHQRKEKTT